MKPDSLRCETLLNPLGLDLPRPRLSWILPSSDRRGVRQTAWQIQAAASAEQLAANQPDLWDSGRVESPDSVLIPYGGLRLASRARCFWKVRVWDETGAVSDWSETAQWEMGLLESSDWNAEWIGSPLTGSPNTTLPAPYLRKEFTIDREVVRARLYVTARGLYEFSINGARVGEDVFTPGDTDYAKRIQYQVYDVTPLLRPGANAAGAVLGDGWYCGNMGWWHQRQNYGERPSLLAQMEVEFADGTRTVIASDATWKTAFGPILEADFLQGEIYDARREMPGWDCAGFDDAAWWKALVLADEGAKRVAMRGPAVRRQKELEPIPTTKDPLFDLGQNMVGWVRVKVTAPAGSTLKIRYGEMLEKDGRIYTANLRSARATDYYTCKGGGEEVWEPRFTFHGFRYVELSGLPIGVTPVKVTGIVVHSDIAPTGQFECSDPLINQLQKNIQWGQRGNFVDIPTDCPQRDERLGWMGDAQVFIRTAAFNFNVAGFFTKWQNDIDDAQAPTGELPMVVPNPIRSLNFANPADGGPAWADAGVICPWTVYLCYGDAGILAEHYDSMRRFVESMKAGSIGLIRSHPDTGRWGGFGDWLALDGGGKTEGITPRDLIGTAFFAYCARLMNRIATVLGKPDDAAKYEALFQEIRAAYQARFITPGGLLASGTQTACVLTLQFDLAPEALRPGILNALVRHIEENGDRLATGFVGTSYLPHVLTRGGRLDVAYRLLHQKQWPSWLYAVTQGATTIWERWDGWTEEKGFQTTGMNSFNHYAYGAIGEWLYATVAGVDLDPERPGYRHAVVKPLPGGGLTWARASLATPYGELSSRWEIKDGMFQLDVVVPSNAAATVCVPAAEGEPVTEGGRPAAEAVEAVGWKEGAAVFRVGSGHYRFAVRRAD
ncbi:MAG: glycoside hydrolase family 78 protein [Chthoniobacteraceae bacterium]|nr:glycoside hydrolase family 78 protein [Chthoniobacteraceae bacterium]